jgi:peptide/nickel transport system permease protein
MSRLRYFLLRTLQTIFTLWIVLTFLYFLFRLMPGDPTDIMLLESDPETVEQFREKWGLNDPLHVQYYRYMVNLLQGDAGTSFQYRQPVLEVVKFRIFNTFILIAPAITFAYFLGTYLGLQLGVKRGSRLEKYGVPSLILSGSFPSFFTSIVLIIVFASFLGLFPTSGMLPPSVSVQYSEAAWYRRYLTTAFAHHYVLPFAAVVLRYLFQPSMIMRTNVIENMNENFMYYHRLTGLADSARLRHITKHSILPVITLYPVSMTRAIGGLVLIETVFNWPGIGFALVQAVLGQDFALIQFVFFLIAAFVILSNFAVDIIYGIIDPRVTVGE